jgi:two-component system KDP operon response regulator KdpE
MSPAAETLLIVEDEAQIRKFVRISLEAQGYQVREARLGEEGLELCVSSPPRLVILDLGLPDLEGLDFIRRLRAWSAIPILVLSVRASETEKIQALDAGANDYVTKPFGIGELMARVRVLLRNEERRAAPSAQLSFPGLRVDLARREVEVDGVPVSLSRKEFALLSLLVASQGQVLTHDQILREVWGQGHQEDTHYLRVLVGNLRQKLGDDPMRPRFILTVQGVGYRLAV